MIDDNDVLGIIGALAGPIGAVEILAELKENGMVVAPRDATSAMIDAGYTHIADCSPADVWADMMKAWLGEANG